ncbi:hypothetical protein [Flagellimonas sp. CMM7]|uniref:hypothetical protein n=1 Tax=Flagellimonas sp. CMM7 TaxID=2654676 RepID=UPI0013D8227D|nr:hypothetical protein [Flagellimonas sp. CMM7]UII80064.1 hypothetical protein LV704_00735 [Flagellimonas sp. CMM7]
MGCDIHMYVEYKKKETARDYWCGFGKRINPGRNYWMFGILSNGVRSEQEYSFEAKGLPEDMSYASKWDSRCYISEDGEGEGECTLESALKWRESYGCKIYFRNEEAYACDDPDWHSHSWLTLNEYKNALEIYNNKENAVEEPEYEALLSAMEKLAEFNNRVRIVFWFDN